MKHAHLLLTCLLAIIFTTAQSQTADNTLSAKEKAAGFTLLFNGKDLTGWRVPLKQTPPEKGWEVVDGTLHVLDSTQGGKSTDILTMKQYSAFELKFDFKITEGANSGVKYFVAESAQSPKSGVGLEFQILDDEHHADAKLGTEGNRTMGSLYDLIPSIKPKPGLEKKIGEWNHGSIIVYPNNLVQHWLNGLKVVEYERGSGIYKVLVAHSKFAKISGFGLGEKGPILLQDHGNSVFFKNIKIREIK
jgi:hypothetical protein